MEDDYGDEAHSNHDDDDDEVQLPVVAVGAHHDEDEDMDDVCHVDDRHCDILRVSAN